MPDIPAEVRAQAEQLTDELFTNGQGDKADRLVLTQDVFGVQRDLGGWGRWPVADLIAAALLAAERRGAQQEAERLQKLAAWIRTPGNINTYDAVDECARLLENNARALAAGQPAERKEP